MVLSIMPCVTIHMYKTKPWDFGRFYSAGLLVSRSQTNLHASCLLIVPIISISAGVARNFTHLYTNAQIYKWAWSTRLQLRIEFLLKIYAYLLQLCIHGQVVMMAACWL